MKFKQYPRIATQLSRQFYLKSVEIDEKGPSSIIIFISIILVSNYYNIYLTS
jgi:hypothetical protein